MTGFAKDGLAVAAAAVDAALSVLRGLDVDELARPTACTEYTVAEVGEHLVRSLTLLASVAGADPSAPAREGDDLAARVGKGAVRTIAAWRRRGLTGDVQVGHSTYPAGLALDIVSLELLVHGWDVADATGRTVPVDDGVIGYVAASARELVTPDRRGRSFAAAVPVDPAATPLEQLAAFTGRRPTRGRSTFPAPPE